MKLSIYVAGGINLADVSLVSVTAVVDKFDRGRNLRWMKTNNSTISLSSLTVFATYLAMSISFGRCPRTCLRYHWFILLTSSGLFLPYYLVGRVTPGVSPTPATRQIFAARFGKARVGTITCECTKHEVYVYIYTSLLCICGVVALKFIFFGTSYTLLFAIINIANQKSKSNKIHVISILFNLASYV